MRKFWILAAVLCIFPVIAFAQMTDQQVIDYVKEASAAGKDKNQISKELMLMGVTRAQAERIQARFDDNVGASVTSQALDDGPIRRERASELETGADETLSELDDAFLGSGRLTPEGEVRGMPIFGHSLFRSSNLTFEPNMNAATPESYVLGPGDGLTIELWGYSEDTIQKTITPEGKISISGIGPIQLSGLTIKQATERIRKQLSKKYASVGGNTSVSVTLSRIRTIQVNVMGDVSTPGTYRLSSFATVFTALHRAGGVRTTGTLRAIKVIRGGEQIATVDVYQYLLEGRSDTDVTLQEGDVVMVSPYISLVGIQGGVKRAMYYELLENETLEKLISYAGGYTGGASRDGITVVRQNSDEKRIFTLKESQTPAFRLCDGDEVTIATGLDRFTNRVEVRGHVLRPGLFELGGEIATLRQLVERAGGLTEDAFLDRAILLREKDDLTLETTSVDLGGILAGISQDVLLRKNDVLIVSGIFELNDRGTLTINGAVASPGTYPFAERTTIEDLVLQAGGLRDGASTVRVDVARRMRDKAATESTDTLGRNYTFALKDGLAVDGADSFFLEPYDIVTVRFSPGYKRQTTVSIGGEVPFPGSYVLLKEEERLSELVKRAGGLTDYAYKEGAILYRRVSEEEQLLRDNIREMLSQSNTQDSLSVRQLDLKDKTFSVGINLGKALQHPGSIDDVILRQGDRVFIPQNTNTVTVQGNVMQPTTVIYTKGKTLNYYINAAGGFGTGARKNKVFIIYMNGRVQKAGLLTRIEPGCEIIVPTKRETRTLTAPEILSMGSTAASLGIAVATFVNLLKK